MTLPEKINVYVVIADLEVALPEARVYSPRLVHPKQANDFAKQVIEVSADAGLLSVAFRSTRAGYAER